VPAALQLHTNRAKLALVALSFRLAATRVSHFAAVARADAGTSDSLTGRLETVKLSPCAHAPSKRTLSWESEWEGLFACRPPSNSV